MNAKRNAWHPPTPRIKPENEDARKARYHGAESRQVLRAGLRRQFGSGRAGMEYRRLMRLEVVPDPNRRGKFTVLRKAEA